jgi:hypothetical protein
MNKDYKVIYYYAKNGEAVYVTDEDNEIKHMKLIDINKRSSKIHNFRMLKGYDNTYEELIKSKKEFSESCKEISKVSLKTKSKKYFSINYKKYFNHNNAVYNNWKAYILDNKKIFELLKASDKIIKEEFYIFEKCYNGALITLNLDYKEKKLECFSVDYSSFYPHLLVDLQIPIKKGVKACFPGRIEYGKLQYGIYRVKITKFNKLFTNVFNFSEDNHYCSSTLNLIYNYKEFFELEFELLRTDEDYDYQAIIYYENQLLRGRDLFGKWLKDMLKVKAALPKNNLVKHLLSTIAGCLYTFNTKYVDDIDGMDISYMDSPKDTKYKCRDSMTDNGQYKIVESENAYKYNLARIKPFLIAQGRNRILKLIMKHNLINKVVAIHTDRITFNEDVNFETLDEKYFPTHEDKSSGLIRFDNSVRYYHICKKCNKDYKFVDGCCK